MRKNDNPINPDEAIDVKEFDQHLHDFIADHSEDIDLEIIAVTMVSRGCMLLRSMHQGNYLNAVNECVRAGEILYATVLKDISADNEEDL